MPVKNEKSRIPVLKSPRKNSPTEEQSTLENNLVAANKSTGLKNSDTSPLKLQECSTRIPVIITSPVNTGVISFSEAANKGRKIVPPSKAGSYSAKYSTTAKIAAAEKSNQGQGILNKSKDKDSRKGTKEKKVDFTLPPKGNAEKSEKVTPVIRVSEKFNPGIQMKEPKNSVDTVALVLEDQINENDGGYVADNLGFQVDPPIDEMKTKLVLKHEISLLPAVPAAIETSVDDPLVFLKASSENMNEPIHAAEDLFLDDSGEDQETPEEEDYSEIQKEILEACENLNLQTAEQALKETHIENVLTDLEMSPDLESPKSPETEQNITFEENASGYAIGYSPVKIGQSDHDAAETEPSIKNPCNHTASSFNSNLENNENSSVTKEDGSINRKSATSFGAEEICTAISLERKKLIEEQPGSNTQEIVDIIKKGNEILDQVENRISWWKTILLWFFVVSAVVGLSLLVYALLHWQFYQPELEQSWLDWISSFWSSKDSEASRKQKDGSFWSWIPWVR